MPSASRLPSAFRCCRVFSANSDSDSVTRPRCSARARSSSRSSRARPRARHVPLRKTLAPRTVSCSPSVTSSNSSERRDVDQRHAAADEQQRAGVRKPPRQRLRHVDDDADAGLEQLLGGDPVEVGVVDDRDIVLGRAGGRGAWSDGRAGRPGELDQLAHGLRFREAVARNSRPPSIRSAPPSARPAPSSWIRVWVGSPGIFSTRKCRSARLAICGRWVIVITCARPASRASVSATPWAVVPPMPASISSKTIVSPPPTAAIASATRESSPPDAVSATGRTAGPRSAGSGTTASSAPVAPGSRSLSSTGTRRLPCRCPAARRRPLRERPGRRGARVAQLPGDLPYTGFGPCRPPRSAAATGSTPWSSASSSVRASAARASSSSQRGAPEAPPRVGDPVELGLDLLEPARVGLERRQERTQRARRLAQPQLGVAQLVGRLLELRGEPLDGRECALGRRRSPAAPSPSSGSSASAAAAAPSTSSVRCRSRSRSSRSASSWPGSSPSVSSTSARSSASRASPAAASRVSSSRRRRAAPSSRQATRASARRRSCSSPQKASRTASWYVGRASRRCSN